MRYEMKRVFSRSGYIASEFETFYNWSMANLSGKAFLLKRRDGVYPFKARRCGMLIREKKTGLERSLVDDIKLSGAKRAFAIACIWDFDGTLLLLDADACTDAIELWNK